MCETWNNISCGQVGTKALRLLAVRTNLHRAARVSVPTMGSRLAQRRLKAQTAGREIWAFQFRGKIAQLEWQTKTPQFTTATFLLRSNFFPF